MKFIFLLLLSVSLCQVALAQDTLTTIYSRQQDTLVSQRFIDRYENVFMTKVPTKHMFKVGLSQYYQTMPFALYNDNVLGNTSLSLGYEYKFAEGFSFAISSQFPFLGYEVPLKFTWNNTAFDAQIRWFYDMKKRILSGKSANNFSGNYLAANYTYTGTSRHVSTTGVKLGFQRRFLNNGFMDFALAFQRVGPLAYLDFGEFSISSQLSLGFAFGDWKRSANPPLCDVLLCNEHISKQWKITIPDLTLGLTMSRLRQGIGFERKLWGSPFSLNFQYDIGLLSGNTYLEKREEYSFPFLNSFYNLTKSKEISQSFSIQPRYYFLQKRQRLNGKGGNGLSGVYSGIHSEYNFYYGRHQIRNFGPHYTLNIRRSNLRIGPLAGFQQRIFDHGFIDLNASYYFQRDLKTSQNSTGLRANLGIGYAF